MKIYFAGSIRGGRDDIELYLKIINHLQNHGQVLTEHIGDKKITGLGEHGLADVKIFERDMAWLEEADVVIADVSVSSLGVGYEIAKAEELGKRILCLHRIQPEKKLSAMIAGNKNILTLVKMYKDLDEALKIIDDFFKTITNP